MSPRGFVARKVLAMAFVAVASSATTTAADTDYGATYGGRAGGSALLPWFEAGPSDGETRRDTLVVITHDDINLPATGEYVHIRLFDVKSAEACNICRRWTREDVLKESIFSIITNECAGTGRALLEAGDSVPGRYVGYATFEPSDSDTCLTIDEEGDFVPYYYQTQLQIGLAAGLNGPTYDDNLQPISSADFDEFALDPGREMYFRILVGLDTPGENALASTRLWIWSDRSGACGADPDSACLRGTSGAEGALRACDEAENCFSAFVPDFDKEVNVLDVDEIIPASFISNGGWMSVVNPTNSPLNVLGYADNEANGLGATLNWRAIFPAQRR